MPPRRLRWFEVDVETASKRSSRPVKLRVASTWEPVEVMGSMVGLKRTERGFRVRLSSGAEMLLVRERMGRWFADERVDDRAGAVGTESKQSRPPPPG